MFYRNDKYIYFALIPISSLLHCFAFYTLHCNKTKLYRHFRFGLNSTTRLSEVQFNFFWGGEDFLFFLFLSHVRKTELINKRWFFSGLLRYLYAIYILTPNGFFYHLNHLFLHFTQVDDKFRPNTIYTPSFIRPRGKCIHQWYYILIVFLNYWLYI